MSIGLSPQTEVMVYALLNQKSALGNNWRLLAHYLGFSELNIMVFEQSSNPCKEMLTAWKCSVGASLPTLVAQLARMERNDVITVMKKQSDLSYQESPKETYSWAHHASGLSVVNSSPLAATIAQQTGLRTLTVTDFLNQESLRHFRTAICLAMNDSIGWERLLKVKGLLGGEGMEQFVSKLKTDWENHRKGDPTLTILTDLVSNDREFASLDLTSFAKLLNSLNLLHVQNEVVKMTSWLDQKASNLKEKSETSYNVQSDLRSWLLKNEICDAIEVDNLIPKLRAAGVKSVESIKDFDKDDLKECGFNTVQAIATIRALKK